MQDQASSQVKKKPSDFVFGKVIGEGSFSTVGYICLPWLSCRYFLNRWCVCYIFLLSL